MKKAIFPLLLLLVFSALAQNSVDSSKIFIDTSYCSGKWNQTAIQQLPYRASDNLQLGLDSTYYLDGKNWYSYGIMDEYDNLTIDGLRFNGISRLPQFAIQSFEYRFFNAPMMYNQTYGGLRNVNTVVPKKNWLLRAEIITNGFLQKYGQNDFNILLGKKFKSEQSFSPYFIAAFNIQLHKDQNPSAILIPEINSETLTDIELHPISQNNNFLPQYKSEWLNSNDVDTYKDKAYAGAVAVNGLVKIRFPFSNGFALNLGSLFDVKKERMFVWENALMNSNNNPEHSSYTSHYYLNLSHNFGGAIKYHYDAFLALGYHIEQIQHPEHKNNFFNYGYIGAFSTKTMRNYEIFAGVAPDSNFYQSYYVYKGLMDTMLNFTSSTINPLLANYNTDLFSLYGQQIRSMDDFVLYNGLRNGNNPQQLHAIWNNPGTIYDLYSIQANAYSQFGINGKLTIDKHEIAAGTKFERNTYSGYSLQPVGLWNVARLNANQHLLNLDNNNFQLSYKDVTGDGIIDTVFDYPVFFDASKQSTFDANLRTAMGISRSTNEFINVDELLPEQLDIAYFSADELINSGMVNYYGFNYKGNLLKTAKNHPDAYYGSTDRIINAYQPIINHSYIQYQYKNKRFYGTAGVGLDYFSANQWQLLDDYSLFEVLTAGEAQNFGVHPTNIGNDFKVYGNNINNPTQINAYRDGDIWYDANGNEFTEIQIQQLALQGQLLPILKNPAQQEKPDFKKTEPVYNLLPDLHFKAQIIPQLAAYVDYTSATRNPQQINIFNPSHYNFLYYLPIVNNPGLKPARSDKAVAGITFQMLQYAVADISYFYIYRKNEFYSKYFVGAYPRSYYIWANDVKTNMTNGFQLGLAWFNPLPSGIHAQLQYTKQDFSDQESPFYAYLQGKVINGYLSYNTSKGDYYKGPSNNLLRGIFKQSGIGLLLHNRSGMHYTKRVAPPLHILEGSINGETMPSITRINLQLEKQIDLSGGKSTLGFFLQCQFV